MKEIIELNSLIEESKTNNEKLVQLLQFFEPKLLKSLYQTAENNREDLKQELIIKFIVAVKNYDLNNVPGFWEFKKKFS